MSLRGGRAAAYRRCAASPGRSTASDSCPGRAARRARPARRDSSRPTSSRRRGLSRPAPSRSAGPRGHNRRSKRCGRVAEDQAERRSLISRSARIVRWPSSASTFRARSRSSKRRGCSVPTAAPGDHRIELHEARTSRAERRSRSERARPRRPRSRRAACSSRGSAPPWCPASSGGGTGGRGPRRPAARRRSSRTARPLQGLSERLQAPVAWPVASAACAQPVVVRRLVGSVGDLVAVGAGSAGCSGRRRRAGPRDDQVAVADGEVAAGRPERLLELDRRLGPQAGRLVEDVDLVPGRPVDLVAGEQAPAVTLRGRPLSGQERTSLPVLTSNRRTRSPVAIRLPLATPSRWASFTSSGSGSVFQTSRPLPASKA